VVVADIWSLDSPAEVVKEKEDDGRMLVVARCDGDELNFAQTSGGLSAIRNVQESNESNRIAWFTGTPPRLITSVCLPESSSFGKAIHP
jgi:hypothetical protein